MKKRIALVVAIIVVLLLVVLFLWRLITLNNIKKLNEESIKISNIHYVEEEKNAIVEIWKKDDIVKENTIVINSDTNMTMWKDLNTDEGYTIFNNSNSYLIGAETIATEPQANNIYLLDYNNTVLLALNPMIKINTKEYDNKSCWYLKNGQEEVYIDKETGIVLYNKSEQSGREIKLKYSINTVTDEDVAKPDLSDYKNRYEQ